MKPITFLAERLPSGGAARPIPIDFDKSPHLICVGGTGTGKSIAAMCASGKVAKIRTSKVYILDYKNDTDTFGFLHGRGEGCRYWRFNDCMDGLNQYYDLFQSELANDDASSHPRGITWLWVDELASWIANSSKSDAENIRSKISTILMLGRSRRFFCLTSVQRASAKLFSQGSRDNYSVCLGLGNLSKESAATLGFSKDEFSPVFGVGGGHLLLNGQQIPVQVPFIGPRGMERMKADILEGVTR